VRYVLEYALVIAWVIAIAAGCFTAGLLIGRSAAESGSYRLLSWTLAIFERKG
jgi:hypothetical protein